MCAVSIQYDPALREEFAKFLISAEELKGRSGCCQNELYLTPYLK